MDRHRPTPTHPGEARRFTLAGVTYILDGDPDTPRLWRAVPVATFGPAWCPEEVWAAARQDRAGLGNDLRSRMPEGRVQT